MSNKNMMSLYMSQIDSGLEEADKYLNALLSNNFDLQIMDNPPSDDSYMLAKLHVSDKLTSDILMYKVDAYFVYSVQKKDLLDVGKSQLLDPADKEPIRSYIRKELEMASSGEAVSNQWYVKQFNRDFYLFRMQKMGSTYVGAWVNIKTLMLPLTLIQFGENGTSLFITDQGEPLIDTPQIAEHRLDLSRPLERYYLTGEHNEFLVVGEPSRKGRFSLVALIPNETILQNLPYLNKIVFIVSFLGLLLLPGFLLFLRKTLLIPLKRMVAVMRRIGEGGVKARIEPYPASDEFQLLNATFNNMMAQIEELTIHVYEEQLNKQKAELQYLQLQINPHFFLNTLNILYSLALVQDYELIKEITLRLVRHFRYMLRSNLTFLPLKEELEHVRNYVRIHELRFQKTLDCQITAPESLALVHVPPLVIQTFIENAIKHATQMNEPLSLSIDIQLEESKQDQHIRITVKDTGKGFPEDVLEKLRAGKRIVDEQGEHIGIWNVWHRLRLLYGDQASLAFANASPSGAVVEMKLPLEPDQSS
ncbi:sensor histidine kinase [Paenibacillus sp. GCM10027628]|uniref:sensor histidine kinase n=1 Tax=Paenibacillus sp. GCM10027628 TaxID=3273413 RepID=UPI003645A61A